MRPIALLYRDVYGIKTRSLRLTNVYGLGMRIKDARQTFLGIWLRRIVEAGPFTVDCSYSNMGEAAVDYLQQVGIRCRLVPMERAAFASAYANKKLTSGIFRAASGAFGNTATRLASFIVKGGSNVYGSYPDMDELFSLQADELDPKKRAMILGKMQRLVHEKAINAPIWELAFLNGVGPRVGESSLGKIAGFPYTAPFEDITIKGS